MAVVRLLGVQGRSAAHRRQGARRRRGAHGARVRPGRPVHLHHRQAAGVSRRPARARARDAHDGERNSPTTQRRSCCKTPVRDDFLVCPNCARRLRDRVQLLPATGRAAWQLCPYCENELTGAPPSTAGLRRPALRAGRADERRTARGLFRGRRITRGDQHGKNVRHGQAQRRSSAAWSARSSRGSSAAACACAG